MTIEHEFTSVSLSKSFFLLNGSEVTQVLDHNLQSKNVYKNSKVQSGPNDDLLLIDDGSSEVKDQDGKAFEKGCSVTRNQDESTLYAMSCPTEFKVVDQAKKVLYATKSLSLEKNGAVKNFFMSGSKDYLIQFEDISLHFFEENKLKWSREEALS
jgi:hypothetical protein